MRSPAATVTTLAPVLDRTLSLFAQEEPVPTIYYSAWSHPMEGEYDDLRRQFAKSSLGVPAWPDQLPRPLDCAVLTDLESKVGMIKLEFGVVNDVELADRLANMRGRLAAALPLPRPSVSPSIKDLPAASLFLEAYVQPYYMDPVLSSADVAVCIDEIEDTISQMVYALATGIHSK